MTFMFSTPALLWALFIGLCLLAVYLLRRDFKRSGASFEYITGVPAQTPQYTEGDLEAFIARHWTQEPGRSDAKFLLSKWGANEGSTEYREYCRKEIDKILAARKKRVERGAFLDAFPAIGVTSIRGAVSAAYRPDVPTEKHKPCPCGDGGGVHCSHDGCPYPPAVKHQSPRKPRAKKPQPAGKKPAKQAKASAAKAKPRAAATTAAERAKAIVDFERRAAATRKIATKPAKKKAAKK